MLPKGAKDTQEKWHVAKEIRFNIEPVNCESTLLTTRVANFFVPLIQQQARATIKVTS